MSTYVMSDIHGAYDEFMQMLKLINFSEEDTLIINGDVIDRGYNVLGLIEYIINAKNIVWLKGNHEDMLVKALRPDADIFCIRMWLENGGFDLYTDLMGMENLEYVQNLANYIENLDTYLIVDKYVIAHANMSHCVLDEMEDENNIDEFIKLQSEDTILWDRSGVNKPLLAPDGYTFIFGHTPVQRVSDNKTNEMIHMGNKIYIDCGVSTCSGNGQLCCLRLEDEKAFYIPKMH